MRVILLFLSLTVFAEQEMLKNGTFKRGLQGWKYATREPCKDVIPKIRRIDGTPTMVLEIPEGGAGNAITLVQASTVADGKTYEAGLVCRLEGSGRGNLKVTKTKKPWPPVGCSHHFTPEKDWKRFVVSFKGEDVGEDLQVFRLILGGLTGTFYLRSLSLREVPDRTIKRGGGDLKVHDVDEPATTKPEPKKPGKKPGNKNKGKDKEKANTPKPKSPRPKPAPASGELSALALLDAFSKDPSKARKAYQGKSIRFSGRVTNLEPALLGDILLELEEGRISILLGGDAITARDTRMIKAALAGGKRQSTVTLNASFIGYRNGSVKMRHGKNVILETGSVPKP